GVHRFEYDLRSGSFAVASISDSRLSIRRSALISGSDHSRRFLRARDVLAPELSRESRPGGPAVLGPGCVRTRSLRYGFCTVGSRRRRAVGVLGEILDHEGSLREPRGQRFMTLGKLAFRYATSGLTLRLT